MAQKHTKNIWQLCVSKISDFLERYSKYNYVFLLLPALVMMIGFFIIPIFRLFTISLYESDPLRIYVPGLTADSYIRFITDPWYLRMVWRTFRLAIVVSIITFLLGYPIAYSIWRARGKKKTLLIFIVMLPLFTNLIIVLYGWVILLSRSGPINSLLLALNLIDEPIMLGYSFTGVVIGLTYVCLPYFILMLMSVLEGIDWVLVESARDLGAGKLRSFYEIVLPLSVPGISAGSAIAFIWCMGAFATPAILGSPAEWTLAMEAEDQLLHCYDWPYGAAISFILLALVLMTLIVFRKLIERGVKTA